MRKSTFMNPIKVIGKTFFQDNRKHKQLKKSNLRKFFRECS